MSYDWKEKRESFGRLDVRELTGNFLPRILEKAKGTEVGEGLCVIQSFEPIPLYSLLAELGFEHETEKVADDEYHVYFYRREAKQATGPGDMDLPFKPTAILNIKDIDDKLADIVVGFWRYIWEPESSALGQKTRILVSLANGVGAGRFRQATRELIKGYSMGITSAEYDELFASFIWNQGVGTFASEIGPSTLFGAYRKIKRLERKEMPRAAIVEALLKDFGEANPEVGTLYQRGE